MEHRKMKAKNATPVEQRHRESFFAQVKREMKGIYRFVRHQLAYYESVGDLLPGELAPEDVVDTVLLRGYPELVKEPRERDIGAWLKELATKHFHSEVTRSKTERSQNVIWRNIPETPAAEAVSTLGEEVLDFYQPDEYLKLEDIFPDEDIATPEDFVAAKEQLPRCVNTALAGMPRQWRRALRLRYFKGRSGADLPEVLDRAKPGVERVLEYARQHLRQSLVESGCMFISKASENLLPSRPSGGTS
jgi:DNA-directed RNA polymerase specialized sigma24 family protein